MKVFWTCRLLLALVVCCPGGAWPSAAAQTGAPAADTRPYMGVGAIRWGMSSAELEALAHGPTASRDLAPLRLSPVTSTKKDMTCYTASIVLTAGSPRTYTLLVWLRADRVQEFEVLPENEVNTTAVIGVTDFEGYRNELFSHVAQTWPGFAQGVRELRGDTLQTRYRYSTPIGVANVPRSVPRTQLNLYTLMPEPAPPGVEYTPQTIYGTATGLTGTPLHFTVVQDDWYINVPEGKFFYRIATLSDALHGPKLAILRWQGRRATEPFPFITTRVHKVNDLKSIHKDIIDNYDLYLSDEQH